MTTKRFIGSLIILAIVCALILLFFVRTAGQPQSDKIAPRGLFHFCIRKETEEKETGGIHREFPALLSSCVGGFCGVISARPGLVGQVLGKVASPDNHIVWPALKRLSSVLPSASVKREC
jgi:hypothetical protein